MTSYRLMDGLAGRPGNGPSTPVTYTGNFIAAFGFDVLQGGCWFEGFWWWVCNSGQSTSPVKCALWFLGGQNGQPVSSTLIPASVVTSGTLTAGAWNFIPLPTPVPLSVGVEYLATVGVNGSFPYQASFFNAGDPYAGGITNGPLNGFSGQTGTNPPPYGVQNGLFSVAGTDPAVVNSWGPDSAGDGATNFWVDVQVRDTAPAGYSGSYRLWPNNQVDGNTLADAAVNYVVGTEVRLSQPCALNKIWFYSLIGTTQLPTAVDVWSIASQLSVAGTASPSWSGPAGSGWVSCSFSGVTLPAGNYRVTAYNGAGSPAPDWSAKRLSYWGGSSLGINSPGLNGITNGPLFAPDTTYGSTTFEYNGNPAGTPAYSNGLTEPGQSVFAQGPPNQYPYLYVDGLFQNYWVDAEVTPVGSGPFTMQAPSTANMASGASFDAGDYVFGLSFKVTQPGCTLEGWWWWRADSSQYAGPEDFALWQVNGHFNGAFVTGSKVTSGTFAVGWNFIPCTTPIPLTSGQEYRAVKSVSGSLDAHPYSTVAAWFDTGPGSAGVVNGPLTVYAKPGATTNPEPSGDGQMTFTAGGRDVTNSADYPSSVFNASYYGLDVQVVIPAPSGGLLLAAFP